VNAGSSANFVVVVANPSAGTATNNVTLSWQLTAPFTATGITYTCTATGDVQCPAAQTPSTQMTLVSPQMGVGRALTYIFTVPVPAISAA